mmetsp:Transcript_24081/g.53833  ORF Transcript_24081/g.53833 Transcript_24081/m.53833 type:complete len:750 (+) Transcript_24081:583-2832(+)
MVKLRTRLIRSPFTGGVTNQRQQIAAAPGGEFDGVSNPMEDGGVQQQHAGGGGMRRSGSSSSLRPVRQNLASSSEVERRPYLLADLPPDVGSASSSRSPTSLRRIFSPNKRKPSDRGITASIRRARTAVRQQHHRQSSSSAEGRDDGPTLASEPDGGRNGDLSSSPDAERLVAMDVAEDGADDDDDDMVEDGPTNASTSIPRALDFFSDENVPPPHANIRGKPAVATGPSAIRIDGRGETTTAASSPHVLQWMANDAPPELLPRLLSFAGSRKLAALSRVSRGWNAVVGDEGVWRVMCEDTHKWSEGDPTPRSWSDHYRLNPSVPIDYDTVEAAVESVSSGDLRVARDNGVEHSFREQRQTCRILVHPGPYFLAKPLVFNVVGSASVTIEGVPVSRLVDPRHALTWRQNYHSEPSAIASPTTSPPGVSNRRSDARGVAGRPSTPTLREIFGCRRSNSAFDDLSFGSSRGDGDYAIDGSHSRDGPSSFRRRADMDTFHSCFDGPRASAFLSFETDRENEPIIRVRQGVVNIRGLRLFHYSEGTDIWNGNAAVQVQSAFGRNGRPVRAQRPNLPPTAVIDDCDITSASGRGVVTIDGAVSNISNSNIHDSAATGIYIGGRGSVATMVTTDVVENGSGNARNPRRGVARGHSGVYVEQGTARLADCNVSSNSLTGISAISTDQAWLCIEASDVCANRTEAMELPSRESGRGSSIDVNVVGLGRPRSSYLQQQHAIKTPRQEGHGGRSPPQSI